MHLKRLSRFIAEHTAEPRPDRETVKRWPGARKIGGRWYVDVDELAAARGLSGGVTGGNADPEVAELVDGVV